jgi:hypothetical protein
MQPKLRRSFHLYFGGTLKRLERSQLRLTRGYPLEKLDISLRSDRTLLSWFQFDASWFWQERAIGMHIIRF